MKRSEILKLISDVLEANEDDVVVPPGAITAVDEFIRSKGHEWKNKPILNKKNLNDWGLDLD